MSCENIKNRLDDYVDGLLPEKSKQEVEAHLESCNACREDLERLRALLANVAMLPKRIEPPHDLWPNISGKILGQKITRSSLQAALPLRSDGAMKSDHTRTKSFGWIPALHMSPWMARSAMAAVLLIAIVGSIWRFIRSREASWEVSRLAGAPTIGSDRIEQTGHLAVGEWLETDSASQAMITVGMIGHVKIDPNTRIRLLQARLTEHRLDLARGRMHATIWAPPRLFFVETAAAVVVDLGCEYTLEVDNQGVGYLHVTSGYVALEQKGREAVVPAGAFCAMRPGFGPGTPYSENASEALRSALDKIDFANGSEAALGVVLREARFADTFTLWHLLIRVDPVQRPRVYDRMVELIPPPEGVTREGVLAGNKEMLEKWAETFGLGYSWWRYWLPL